MHKGLIPSVSFENKVEETLSENKNDDHIALMAKIKELQKLKEEIASRRGLGSNQTLSFYTFFTARLSFTALFFWRFFWA
jgi:hypothetical protein